jgi:AcrR family transcriptional regulator
MARIVKEPDIRRSEILDAAQLLFYTRGYEQTSIQDIIDQVGIAKGTFYHYFGSKVDLLDELIVRMVDQSMVFISAVACDDQLDARQKLIHMFARVGSWKAQSKSFLLDILRPYYSDDNAVLRQKMLAMGVSRMAPIFTLIIRQGIAEGQFETDHPDDLAEVILAILTAWSDNLAVMILQKPENSDLWPIARQKSLVSQYAIERVLGAAPGTLPLIDLNSLQLWFE